MLHIDEDTGPREVAQYMSPSEQIARLPEASDRFRSFISRTQLDHVEKDGVLYEHVELAGVSELGTMLHLRRAARHATDIHEADFLLEIATPSLDLGSATIKTVRELPDGDGSSLHMLFETPDQSYVIELSQTRCVLNDLGAGSEDRIMHYLEMFNRVEGLKLQDRK